MSIEEIEQAIQSLSADEFARIAARIHALEQERWDAELDPTPIPHYYGTHSHHEFLPAPTTFWPPDQS